MYPRAAMYGNSDNVIVPVFVVVVTLHGTRRIGRSHVPAVLTVTGVMLT